MKTQKELEERLEKVAEQLQKLAESISEAEKDNLPKEKQAEVCCTLGIIFGLGWALGCEEELKGLLRTLKVSASLQSMEGLL